jgi:hypothetical protein
VGGDSNVIIVVGIPGSRTIGFHRMIFQDITVEREIDLVNWVLQRGTQGNQSIEEK